LGIIVIIHAGMRISDVLCLKWSDFEDSRLHYTMAKNSKLICEKQRQFDHLEQIMYWLPVTEHGLQQTDQCTFRA
jgi:hypothetical protein